MEDEIENAQPDPGLPGQPPEQPEPEPLAAGPAVTETRDGGLQVDPEAGIREIEPEPTPRSILTFDQAVNMAKMTGEDQSGAKTLRFLDIDVSFVTNPKVLAVEYLCVQVVDDPSAITAMLNLAHSIIDKAAIATKVREIASYMEEGSMVSAWEALVLDLFPDEAKKAGYSGQPGTDELGGDRGPAADALDDAPADSGAPDSAGSAGHSGG